MGRDDASCVLRLEKKRLFPFLNAVMAGFTLIAPIKKDLVRFEKVIHPEDIYLETNAYFPLKEFFFRKQEVLFTFTGTKLRVPGLSEPKRAFFGIRRCDLNGILHQDKVFLEQTHDPYYAALRKNSYLLGYHCPAAPSPYCFCGSLELADFHDVMFYDKQSYLLAESGSQKGEEFLRGYSNFFEQRHRKAVQPRRLEEGG